MAEPSIEHQEGEETMTSSKQIAGVVGPTREIAATLAAPVPVA